MHIVQVIILLQKKKLNPNPLSGSVSLKRIRIRPFKKPAKNYRKDIKLQNLDYFVPYISYIGALYGYKQHNNIFWVIRRKKDFRKKVLGTDPDTFLHETDPQHCSVLLL